MGLAELLAQGSRGGSSRRAAWERLYPELRSFLSSVSAFQRLQDTERDEFLHDLAEKLFSMGPIPVADKSEGECRAYVRSMFLNLLRDRARKGWRETVVEEPPDIAERPTAEALLHLKRMGELLDCVYQALWEKRRERYRPELERDWAEMSGLLSGEWHMERSLLEREQVGPDASPEARADAAQRIYKRHSRLRDSLVLMARKMADAGRLSAEEFELVEKLSDGMDRSQQKGGKP